MDKKELAKLFVDSFQTKIEKIILEGELDGTGGTVEQRKYGEVIFRNHALYEKSQFSNDYLRFAKKLGETYGVDWREIKKPMCSKKRYKSFYYQWDPEQVIEVDGFKFRLGRKMMNLPHAVLDGCSHTYYVCVYDLELLEEIKKLNDQRLADEQKKREDAWPGKVEKAKTQCQEMIESLQKWVNGEMNFDEHAVSRINDAHFDVCVMLNA